MDQDCLEIKSASNPEQMVHARVSVLPNSINTAAQGSPVVSVDTETWLPAEKPRYSGNLHVNKKLNEGPPDHLEINAHVRTTWGSRLMSAALRTAAEHIDNQLQCQHSLHSTAPVTQSHYNGTHHCAYIRGWLY